MRFLPVNSKAFLVELDDLDQTLALLASLRRSPVAGIVELVPAARTLLVRFDSRIHDPMVLIDVIARRDVSPMRDHSHGLVTIPVYYDGEDLAEVASLLRVDPVEIVRRHTQSEYVVAFTGFAPGFGYLAGGDARLAVPRRTTPRTRIPAGSVGLAGAFSGIYPRASPGGWQIIGTTPSIMWDTNRDPPALLQPGTRVRFVNAAELSAVELEEFAPVNDHPLETSRRTANSSTGGSLEVVATGLQTLLQDLGRPGLAGLGVSTSGAIDQTACKAVNRLVGNDSDAACLETFRGGLVLRCRGEAVVAVTGADARLVVTDARGSQWSAPSWQPFALAAGDTLAVNEPTSGARCYVAARGGFDVEPVLGSCSTDTLARIGPPPIAKGDLLHIRVSRSGAIVGFPQVPPCELPSAGRDIVLDVVLGPRTDWFSSRSIELLAHQRWLATAQSDRVGIRLSGAEPLSRAIDEELPSEGTVAGAIQVPPSGQPVLFLADHPLTGGYPVIGCVAPHHLDLAGQIPTGAWVRFKPIRVFRPFISDAKPTMARTPTVEQE